MSELENKYLLGGLTLRDLVEKIETLGVWCVDIDGYFWERFQFNPDKIELWKSNGEYLEGMSADEDIDLDTPAKIRDGKVLVTMAGVEQEMTFGKTQFIPQEIKIP